MLIRYVSCLLTLGKDGSINVGSELADFRYACKYPHPTDLSVRLLLYRLPHNVTRFACVMCVVMIVACWSMAGWCRSPNHAYHRHHHRQVAHPSSAWAILAQVGEGRSDFFCRPFPPTPLGSDRDLNQKWLCESVCCGSGSRGNPSCWITSQSRAGR